MSVNESFYDKKVGATQTDPDLALRLMGVSLVVKRLQWGFLGLQARKIATLNPAEVGQDQSGVVGGYTGPSVPHTTINRQLTKIV